MVNFLQLKLSPFSLSFPPFILQPLDNYLLALKVKGDIYVGRLIRVIEDVMYVERLIRVIEV